MKGSFSLRLWMALLLLCCLSIARAQWTQSGSNIYYNAGNVGIGTSSPAYLLHVETSLSSRAIFGKQSASSGSAYGGWFETASTSGMGVYGLATATTGYTYGVYGRTYSTSGKGIMGHAAATSGATYGMYGLSDSTAGMGVYGWATAGSGSTIGAVGRAASTSGIGVKGFVTATSGTNYGGWFESASAGGTGVIGVHSASTGTAAGVHGKTNSTSDNAVAVLGEVIPQSPGAQSAAVRGINWGTGGLGIGVWGSHEGSGWGVYGTSASGVGVYGYTGIGAYGVYGRSDSINGRGVYGLATAGSGNTLHKHQPQWHRRIRLRSCLKRHNHRSIWTEQ